MSHSSKVAELLQRLQYVVLDGGSATEMVRLGYKSVDDDPLWSARLLHTKPDVVKLVCKNFLEAGCEILDTASYQASIGGYVGHLGVTEDQASELIGRSVTLAREACKETGIDAIVAGCVGPYGAVLCDGSEYTGNYVENITVEELKCWHRPRVSALLSAGADMLAIDTIPAAKEADALIELLREFPQAKAWFCFSCKNEQSTCHGESFSDVIKSVTSSDQIVAAGVNCTAPEHISGLLKSVQHLNLTKPVVIKPNSGEQWVRGTGVTESYVNWSLFSPSIKNDSLMWFACEGYITIAGTYVHRYRGYQAGQVEGWIQGSCSVDAKSQVDLWMEQGARWIGGCCRIYPTDIAHIRHTVDTHRGQSK